MPVSGHSELKNADLRHLKPNNAGDKEVEVGHRSLLSNTKRCQDRKQTEKDGNPKTDQEKKNQETGGNMNREADRKEEDEMI